MNLELNVVRFENEDVIATSGVCAHINAYSNYYGHVNVIAYDQPNGSRLNAIDYDPINGANGGDMLESHGATIVSYTDQAFADINSNGWWYYDAGLGKYVKCSDQSAEAHPISDN